MWDWLKEAAEERQTSRAGMIRILIASAMKREKKIKRGRFNNLMMKSFTNDLWRIVNNLQQHPCRTMRSPAALLPLLQGS